MKSYRFMDKFQANPRTYRKKPKVSEESDMASIENESHSFKKALLATGYSGRRGDVLIIDEAKLIENITAESIVHKSPTGRIHRTSKMGDIRTYEITLKDLEEIGEKWKKSREILMRTLFKKVEDSLFYGTTSAAIKESKDPYSVSSKYGYDTDDKPDQDKVVSVDYASLESRVLSYFTRPSLIPPHVKMTHAFLDSYKHFKGDDKPETPIEKEETCKLLKVRPKGSTGIVMEAWQYRCGAPDRNPSFLSRFGEVYGMGECLTIQTSVCGNLYVFHHDYLVKSSCLVSRIPEEKFNETFELVPAELLKLV